VTITPSPLNVGGTLTAVQLSPCVNGLVRTWADDNEPRLWSTPDADRLVSLQGTGQIARTLQMEGRFREVGMLSESGATLLLQSRFPLKADDNTYSVQANVVRLEPARAPDAPAVDALRTVLAQAVQHCVDHNEYLVVEKGGWDAPEEPYCLFILAPDEQTGEPFSAVATAPTPTGAALWAHLITPGLPDQSATAPATPATLNVVPLLMIDAIRTWGLQPWDLALTFGRT